jgi:SAM-dependent methyltransferase
VKAYFWSYEILRREMPPALFARKLTRNRMGWVSGVVSELSWAWVEECRLAGEGLSLDIGAAFGAACVEALRTGARVAANDLDEGHLEELRRLAGAGARLEAKPGHFPDGLHFEAGSLWSVHMSNVAHFLTGKKLEYGLRLIRRWLRPGGRLYLQAVTPFQAVFAGFLPEYERRVREGVRWPGYLEKVSRYARHRQFSQMPRSVHLLDEAVLRRTAAEAGLVVERCWYFRRADQPRELWLDGRESAGLIARAPEEAGEPLEGRFEYVPSGGVTDADG